ncbi:hypothetical protein [Thiothrix lacustris]|uniref:hypothetical protein n=1 Tax=Thiothrix lacustris TaxID=525917 RepID=UPI0027E46016|nr:hypothetical protein [Thiothrix lacustris]WMP16842.1 hypothetical protein RCS87_15870 [Thiothrix lacustris]
MSQAAQVSVLEFPLFTWFGNDLPGALIVTPLEPEQVPAWALMRNKTQTAPVIVPVSHYGQRFSLAGVQIPGRYRGFRANPAKIPRQQLRNVGAHPSAIQP